MPEYSHAHRQGARRCGAAVHARRAIGDVLPNGDQPNAAKANLRSQRKMKATGRTSEKTTFIFQEE